MLRETMEQMFQNFGNTLQEVLREERKSSKDTPQREEEQTETSSRRGQKMGGKDKPSKALSRLHVIQL